MYGTCLCYVECKNKKSEFKSKALFYPLILHFLVPWPGWLHRRVLA